MNHSASYEICMYTTVVRVKCHCSCNLRTFLESYYTSMGGGYRDLHSVLSRCCGSRVMSWAGFDSSRWRDSSGLSATSWGWLVCRPKHSWLFYGRNPWSNLENVRLKCPIHHQGSLSNNYSPVSLQHESLFRCGRRLDEYICWSSKVLCNFSVYWQNNWLRCWGESDAQVKQNQDIPGVLPVLRERLDRLLVTLGLHAAITSQSLSSLFLAIPFHQSEVFPCQVITRGDESEGEYCGELGGYWLSRLRTRIGRQEVTGVIELQRGSTKHNWHLKWNTSVLSLIQSK